MCCQSEKETDTQPSLTNTDDVKGSHAEEDSSISEHGEDLARRRRGALVCLGLCVAPLCYAVLYENPHESTNTQRSYFRARKWWSEPVGRAKAPSWTVTLPDDNPKARQAQIIVNRMTDCAGLDCCRVHIFVDDDPTPYICSNSEIYIPTGLLGTCEDEAEQAVMLGNSLASAVEHHAAKQLGNKSVQWATVAA